MKNENYKNFLLIRPLLSGMEEDKLGMPVIKRPKLPDCDSLNIRLTNFKNLKTLKHREATIISMFNYDDVLEAVWNDPFKYVSKFHDCLAVSSPDFSVFTNMNKNEIKHNIFKSRWVGSVWQSMGVNVIPTVSWAREDTFDICFSGLEKNSIVIISTIGVAKNRQVFIEGFKELKARIDPELMIVLGPIQPEMTGNFLSFSLNETFTQNARYEQLRLFETNNYLVIEKGGDVYGR